MTNKWIFNECVETDFAVSLLVLTMYIKMYDINITLSFWFEHKKFNC